jgi:ribonuclease P protein component
MFTILYRHNFSNMARLGLAVGKKNCRKATGRNRLKRIIRESFRDEQGHLPDIDIVVLNQPAATHANNKALFLSLKKHWQHCSGQAPKTAG